MPARTAACVDGSQGARRAAHAREWTPGPLTPDELAHFFREGWVLKDALFDRDDPLLLGAVEGPLPRPSLPCATNGSLAVPLVRCKPLSTRRLVHSVAEAIAGAGGVLVIWM